ncbi:MULTISPECIES: hypothetical protein [unclassified Microcoleus]|nr:MULTISPECIES: hypothetical protein [unclassified Microcoleus]MCC3431764.1 hypothetical protein [Microcoleus sp. PH2017_04_SCI_O_A]MCC3442532.1 hypothetical protein [Microcoleus sp. PH2017_03_ELD_O_A]MCC3505791.1 hypothetical protein [Microcoleus sp. PH2017_19_SFW_U_A]MCC3513155.1 hypothetical protein [Microcoleus sp. PH2017_17_BER_D_A]MCC3524244.1 hypothetical protein [Microcoleus sp. PH2017_20_SFW_D_A]MCC3569219.1 hypothetical protein [Microcoleus sp. PH2017_31_RDM_U_A]MCC3600666.1 hypot
MHHYQHFGSGTSRLRLTGAASEGEILMGKGRSRSLNPDYFKCCGQIVL